MKKNKFLKKLIVLMYITVFICNVTKISYAVDSLPEINYKINGNAFIGETYEINIDIKNIKNLYGFSLDFAYDHSMMEILEVSKGDIFDNTNAKVAINKKNNEQPFGCSLL